MPHTGACKPSLGRTHTGRWEAVTYVALELLVRLLDILQLRFDLTNKQTRGKNGGP